MSVSLRPQDREHSELDLLKVMSEHERRWGNVSPLSMGLTGADLRQLDVPVPGWLIAKFTGQVMWYVGFNFIYPVIKTLSPQVQKTEDAAWEWKEKKQKKIGYLAKERLEGVGEFFQKVGNFLKKKGFKTNFEAESERRSREFFGFPITAEDFFNLQRSSTMESISNVEGFSTE